VLDKRCTGHLGGSKQARRSSARTRSAAADAQARLLLRLPAWHERGGGRPRHVREALTGDGTWLSRRAVRGQPGGTPSTRIGPAVLPLFSLLGVPDARSQPGCSPLGARAAQAAIRSVASRAGLTGVHRAAETASCSVRQAQP